MDNTGYLLAANVAVWIGLGGYLAFLALGQSRLARRIKQLETLAHDD